MLEIKLEPEIVKSLDISEYDWKRIDSFEGLIKEGDIIKVQYVGDDPKTKKIKLSRKVLLPKPEDAK